MTKKPVVPEVNQVPSSAEQFPLTTEVATALGSYGSPEHYDLVLERLLTGLRAMTAPA
jgi:hypothetical protein